MKKIVERTIYVIGCISILAFLSMPAIMFLMDKAYDELRADGYYLPGKDTVASWGKHWEYQILGGNDPKTAEKNYSFCCENNFYIDGLSDSITAYREADDVIYFITAKGLAVMDLHFNLFIQFDCLDEVSEQYAAGFKNLKKFRYLQ